MKAKVSIIQCEDYTPDQVYRKVKEGINLIGGIDAFVSKGEKVLLKPNFLVDRPPEKCVTTHPEVVRAVATLVLEAGAHPFIGDSPNLGSTLKVAEKCGVAQVARELGIEIVEFEPVEVTHPQGKFFKRFVVGKAVREADKIINLPKLKTHNLTFLTLAVKNIFGCVPGARKAQWHVKTSSQDNEYFSKMLLDLYTLINPVLSVVDGIVSMEGKGPGSGTPRNLGVLIAGTDAVAVDAIITEIVGAPPEQFTTLKVALKEHYGVARREEIEVWGEAIEKVKVGDYQFPPKIIEIKGFLKTFLGFLKGPLTTHPEIDTTKCEQCANCAEACPLKCITALENKFIINSKECIQCLCCMEVCPHAAIDLKEGSLLKLFKHLKK
jgi:uncharacterized protein (DUF362 family)/NAD-dependent dihydropyrimidine dehydrogenase PreA subunit